MDKINKVLIVVDMQKDFIDGSLGTKEAQAIVPAVRDKIREYALNKDEIIFTQDTHYAADYLQTNEGKHLPVLHCVIGTDGYNIETSLLQAVDKIANYFVLPKSSFGYIHWKDIFKVNKWNNKNIEIEICGLCTDICVIVNALILKTLYPEAVIKIDSNCCAGTTPEKHKEALDVMKSCQIEVI